MKARSISFSPPDITEAEIAAVADTLRSGWITTGPKTKQLEKELREFTQSAGVACLSSATAALECTLRALGIGPGDEVITSAYTYTASCSPICHVGATPVLCDIAPDSFEMDYEKLASLITPKTKAIIPVDIAGRMCDYDALFASIKQANVRFEASSPLQEHFGRPIVVADAAHSLGAVYKGTPSGSVADFTTFSFHAVKNFTTAEGGAVAWKEAGLDNEALYKLFMLLSLHGQNKDALEKSKKDAWEYDIVMTGWKCNMTDIMAAIGLEQLKRYPGLLARRRQLIEAYEAGLADLPVAIMPHYDAGSSSSGHLMLVNLCGKSLDFRNELIRKMSAHGVATNVHFKPLPLLTAYKNLGFAIEDFPQAFARYQNEITLPLHTLLSDEDLAYIVEMFHEAYAETASELEG